MTNKQFVTNTALAASRMGITLSANQLIDRLNRKGLSTSYGTSYVYGRGVYRLIHATYNSLVAQGLQPEADIVATVFTNQYGYHAWDK